MKYTTIFIAIIFLLSGCLPELYNEQITSFPDIDLNTEIYFQSITNFAHNYGVSQIGFYRSKIDNTETKHLISSNFEIPDLIRHSKIPRIVGSYSKSGNHVSTYGGKPLDVKFKNESAFAIYNIESARKIFIANSKIPIAEYPYEEYQLPWSKKEEAFFVFSKNQIKKITVDQQEYIIFEGEEIRNFAVSNNDSLILVQENQHIFVYNILTMEKKPILSNDKSIRVSTYVRGMSWTPGNRNLAFASNSWLYVHNIPSGNTTRFTTREPIFYSLWISGSEIIFVTGRYPANKYVTSNAEYFKINKLNISTGEITLLYKNMSGQPFSIKPQLSPSKDFIIFSSGKLQSSFVMVLLSVDGNRIKYLWDGSYPQWISN
ncbi:MAG: hypothetical protein U9R19_07885 [Bacteroidota bacterium]|nr:hypothetical protein [Bacteroidota bacterium]